MVIEQTQAPIILSKDSTKQKKREVLKCEVFIAFVRHIS